MQKFQEQALQGIYERLEAKQNENFKQLHSELTRQMSELVSKFMNPQGMPSQIVPNPNSKPESHQKQVLFKDLGPSKQNAHAINLRSGRSVGNSHTPLDGDTTGSSSEDELRNTSEESDSSDEEELPQHDNIRIPFPDALKPKRKLPKGNNPEVEEILKNVVIEIPLLKALEQIPTYAKFMKQKCTPKRRSRSPKKKNKVTVPTVHTVTTSVPNLHTKKPDPGAPIIACSIGGHYFTNVLLDDGASINLIPASLVEKFGLGPVKNTSMTLEFADKSFKQPKGVIENVIVNIGEQNYPVDFVVLDVESTGRMNETQVILGRPFHATAQIIKNYAEGIIECLIQGEKYIVWTEQQKKKREEKEEKEIKALEKYWNCHKVEISKVNRKPKPKAKQSTEKESGVSSLQKQNGLTTFGGSKSFYHPLALEKQHFDPLTFVKSHSSNSNSHSQFLHLDPHRAGIT